jgi:PKD repeat protein
MKKAIYQLGLWSMILALVFACDEDPVETDPPTASFQFEVGETDFLTVTFTNFSQNYESSEWDFGDGSEGSTEESPVHTYEAAGDYTVTLTVTNAAGESATREEVVEVSDPNEKLTLLAGTESKTWKLVREGTSMLLASDPEYTQIYWPGLQNDGQRPCQYDDSFTFTREGDYIYDDGGSFWGEFGVWGGDLLETCFDAVPENMVNANGDDVSAWLGDTHSYSYDAANNQITLSGEGAWMGIPKLATGGESLVPVDGVTFNATVVDGADTGVDTLYINFNYEGAFWPITYVSYEDPSLEPELVTEFVPEECSPLEAVSPEIISHTFASNDASEWNLLQPSESGAGLELGVDDPTDATATKVGKYIRNAGTDFQELQFKLDPLNAINFENLSTITMDVYMPSSNDYSGDLTDNVFIGFGATECPPDWFTDQHEYQEVAVEKDTWVTITFDLTDPAYVAQPDNGATVFDRNDLDMIYIAIGGAGHGVGGEFFMRNFKIE